MFRWLVRFAAAAFIGALLVWLWNRYNEDLLEEDLEEEIPLEFDVAADDRPVLEPVSASTDGATDGAEAAVAAAEAAEAPAGTAAATTADDAADDDESDEATLLDSSAPTPEGAGDNVIAIKGIGPKYGAKLAEMGITTFGALLATPMDTLELAFPRVSGEELQSWLEQAREMAAQKHETA